MPEAAPVIAATRSSKSLMMPAQDANGTAGSATGPENSMKESSISLIFSAR